MHLSRRGLFGMLAGVPLAAAIPAEARLTLAPPTVYVPGGPPGTILRNCTVTSSWIEKAGDRIVFRGYKEIDYDGEGREVARREVGRDGMMTWARRT
jgi:hypothetical protein